jgi:hypothetical protein
MDASEMCGCGGERSTMHAELTWWLLGSVVLRIRDEDFGSCS